MEGFEMPRGYRWDRGTSYYQMDKEDQEVRFALIMIFCPLSCFLRVFSLNLLYCRSRS